MNPTREPVKIMKSTSFMLHAVATSLFFTGALAQAAQVSGTVTNKTTGKPAAGDTVVLVDVQSAMAEVAHSTTDARGHYSITEPGSGPYLVRATHQGAGYFIAAPQGATPGDITVYDVAAKVESVFAEADVMEMETANGRLRVIERYFVHNASKPPTTQWSPRSFEIVLPDEAVVENAEAQRPGGLPTTLSLEPAGAKGHFAFNFPIQPDDGEKNTLFQFSYTVPYRGSLTFRPQMTLPTQSIGVLLPKSITFKAGGGSVFQSVPQDPSIQTLVAKNAVPGKPLEFTISGEGQMPREAQGAPAGAQAAGDNGGQDAGMPTQPGGGIGNPINTPDPLSKYKWWILGALALLLTTAAAFLLRKPQTPDPAFTGGHLAANPASRSAVLMNALKEELFALESEKIAGTLSAKEYAEVKAALEIVLKRALDRKRS